jgi:hypothetical protein
LLRKIVNSYLRSEALAPGNAILAGGIVIFKPGNAIPDYGIAILWHGIVIP